MAGFKRISILGILDSQDISFDFAVSPFFLVGPNGTGKSTALKILHYILTAQWSGMRALPFFGVEVQFNDGDEHVYEKPTFEQLARVTNYLTRYMRRAAKPPVGLIPEDWETAANILQGRHPSARRRSPALLDAQQRSEGRLVQGVCAERGSVCDGCAVLDRTAESY